MTTLNTLPLPILSQRKRCLCSFPLFLWAGVGKRELLRQHQSETPVSSSRRAQPTHHRVQKPLPEGSANMQTPGPHFLEMDLQGPGWPQSLHVHKDLCNPNAGGKWIWESLFNVTLTQVMELPQLLPPVKDKRQNSRVLQIIWRKKSTNI